VIEGALPAAELLAELDGVPEATPAPSLDSIVLVPMFVTRSLLGAAVTQGNLRVFGDPWERLAQKEWLHPRPGATVGTSGPVSLPKGGIMGNLAALQRALRESSAAEVCGLRRGEDIPRGYRCETNEELVMA